MIKRRQKNVFYLDFNKAKEIGALIEWEDYKNRYTINNIKNVQYKALVGTPLVIRIEGVYVLVDKIPDLFKNPPYEILDYIRGLKQVSLSPFHIKLKWKEE